MRKYNMIFAALVCVMLSVACNISDPSEIPPSVEDGYGKIYINFAIGENMAARTVLPSLTTLTEYEYTFTKAGETTGVEKIPGTDGSFLLELGSYTVSVKAYTGTAAPHTLAASGVSSEFSVTAGENPSVRVNLNEAGAGQGVFSYTITYTAGATAEITLKKWPNMENVTLSPTDIDITNGKAETLSVDAGSYLLTVKISLDDLNTGISEAVHIYPLLSTEYINDFSIVVVNFDANGGDGTVQAKAVFPNFGISITLPDGSGLSKSDYAFVGWNTAANGTGDNYSAGSFYTPTGNITFYAVWIPTYTITFDANEGNGTPPAAITEKSGSNIALPDGNGLEMDDYFFSGWNTNSTGTGTNYNAGASYTVNGNTTLYAKWVPAQTITFDANEATGGTPPDAITAGSGFEITLPDGNGLEMDDYFFSGWNTNSTGTGINYNAGESYTVSGDATLYAKWVPAQTITFDANGGTGTPPAAITTGFGLEITLPGGNGLEMSGYAFGGWNTNSSGTGTNYNAGASYTVSGDTTLYARWVHTITFNANGGSGTAPAVITANAGSSITLPDQGSLTRTGYTFSGWNTNSSGTGDNYNAGASYTVNSSATLYAKWRLGDGSEANPFLMAADTWANDSIASSGSVVWYSFNVTSGTTYYVWWNDSYQGNSKTLDVKVSANYSSGGTSIFSGVDSGWTTPRSFTANSNDTVKIKVEPFSSGTGTFAVVYSTSSTRP